MRPSTPCVLVLAALGVAITHDFLRWPYSFVPVVVFLSASAAVNGIVARGRSDLEGAAEPKLILRGDRWSTVVEAMFATVAVGATAVLLFKAELSTLSQANWMAAARSADVNTNLMTTLERTATILAGATVFIVVVLARGCEHWIIAKIELASRGRLPWRLMAFLKDAHRRGVLRRTGGYYQFRLATLQDYLGKLGGLPYSGDGHADHRVGGGWPRIPTTRCAAFQRVRICGIGGWS